MAQVVANLPEAFEFLFQPARIKVAYGGRGAGKSESIGRWLLGEGLREPQNIVCGREIQASIKESVHSMLDYLIGEMGIRDHYQTLNTEIRGKNGTLFSFVGLKHNISSIKSMHNVKKFWGEEAQAFSQRSLEVLFPTIRAENSELIFSLNPELEEDPAYQMLVLNPPPGSLVRKINYYDNPYLPEVLRKEMEYMKANDYQKYLHIWEGDTKAMVEGAIYTEEMMRAQEEGRIGDFKIQPAIPVSTYWDIGEANFMSIWCAQKIGLNFYLVDFIQDHLKKVPYYIQLLQERGYTYDRMVLPHDAKHDRANAMFSTFQMVKSAFPNAKIDVNENFPGAINFGIEAVRNIFPFLHFDKVKCADGLFSLRRYHFKVNPQGRAYGEEPDHEYSDAPDALRMMAMAYRKEKAPLDELDQLKMQQKKRLVGQSGRSGAWWK